MSEKQEKKEKRYFRKGIDVEESLRSHKLTTAEIPSEYKPKPSKEKAVKDE